jgi:energy-coupling factor transport system ATP-binding protein
MGTVFQDPEEQIVGTRCDDEAVMALEAMGLEPGEMDRRLSLAFERFHLKGKKNRNPLSLSGGEKKRLLLAALEMQDPELWILDETLDELDREGQTFLLDYLKTLADEREKGVLLFASKYKESFGGAGIPMALLHGGRLTREEDCGDFRALLEAEGLISRPVRIGAVRGGTERVTADGGKDGLTEGLTDGSIEQSRAGRSSAENPAVKDDPAAAPPLFELKDIRYAYPGNGEFSLDIPSLSINRGEIVALCGPNGCGKTTLARILSGLITPDAGEISSGGRQSMTGEELNLVCGYLFQNPDYQLFLPTVEEELALGLRYSGVKREERKRRCDEACRLFALPGAEAPPALLSFGARKKLQGAIYSLLDKDLYILDEADSGLGFRDYLLILERLAARGASLLVISHDETVQNLGAHRIIRMAAGSLEAEPDRDVPSREAGL